MLKITILITNTMTLSQLKKKILNTSMVQRYTNTK